MPLTNTETAYGNVAKSFHWIIALGIFTVIPLGVIAHKMSVSIQAGNATPETVTTAATLFSLHKTVGLVIFFTALARIIWAFIQPKPAPLASHKKWEHSLSALVHWLLYGSLALVPLTGWITHAATSGFAPIWWPFGQNLPFVEVSQDTAHLFSNLHMLFERVMVISLFLHIAGALKHHFIDRDSTLRRMTHGTATEATISRHASITPLLGALGIWALALGIGNMAGLFAKTEAAQIETLEAAQGEWQVDEGVLGLTITQFGSPVPGVFEDWSADISFTPPSTRGANDATGQVRTTINIASLSLGSVTDQALGADFFAADDHPTALFTGEITGGDDDAYLATGTLTIKDNTVPLTLPFTMQVIENTATMKGSVSLNRMDFGIGATMNDESSLLFGVDVTVELSATRAQD